MGPASNFRLSWGGTIVSTNGRAAPFESLYFCCAQKLPRRPRQHFCTGRRQNAQEVVSARLSDRVEAVAALEHPPLSSDKTRDIRDRGTPNTQKKLRPKTTAGTQTQLAAYSTEAPGSEVLNFQRQVEQQRLFGVYVRWRNSSHRVTSPQSLPVYSTRRGKAAEVADTTAVEDNPAGVVVCQTSVPMGDYRRAPAAVVISGSPRDGAPVGRVATSAPW